MMTQLTPATLQAHFCGQFHVNASRRRGFEGFTVRSPFGWGDGDSFLVFIYRTDFGKWHVTDNGNTLSILSLEENDLCKEGREEMLTALLDRFGISQQVNGELQIVVENDDFTDAVFRFLQCQSMICTLPLITRKPMRCTLQDDLRAATTMAFPMGILFENWTDEQIDKAGNYTVDVRILTRSGPVFVFGAANDHWAMKSIITANYFKRHNYSSHDMVVVQRDSQTSEQVSRQLSDTFPRQVRWEEADGIDSLANKLHYALPR